MNIVPNHSSQPTANAAAELDVMISPSKIKSS
jgi:hypothetical protein